MTRSNAQKDYTPRDDYYTPKEIFDALNLTFNIDVCAPKGGVKWIPAINYFDLERDGLLNKWEGDVWMNPPYSNPKPWIEKFVHHANGIGLITMSRSKAFYGLWNNPDVLFAVPETAMKFVTPDGQKCQVFMPTCFIAMGKRCQNALKQAGLGYVR